MDLNLIANRGMEDESGKFGAGRWKREAGSGKLGVGQLPITN